MTNPPSNNPPQFNTAEYPAGPGAGRCASCQQPITGSYYRVNKAVACVPCANRMNREFPRDTPAAFTRGLVFGIGGAVLGLILYAAFGIITGWMIGYESLAVGYIVGKAVMMGSGGVGGRRFQMAAIVLTYAAVSIAAIPIAISQHARARRVALSVQSQAVEASPGGAPGGAATRQARQPARARRPPNLAAAIGVLALIGLASPFLALRDPVHGIIGLVILFVGIRIAWRIAVGISLQIQGPFKMAAAAPAAPQARAG